MTFEGDSIYANGIGSGGLSVGKAASVVGAWQDLYGKLVFKVESAPTGEVEIPLEEIVREGNQYRLNDAPTLVAIPDKVPLIFRSGIRKACPPASPRLVDLVLSGETIEWPDAKGKLREVRPLEDVTPAALARSFLMTAELHQFSGERLRELNRRFQILTCLRHGCTFEAVNQFGFPYRGQRSDVPRGLVDVYE